MLKKREGESLLFFAKKNFYAWPGLVYAGLALSAVCAVAVVAYAHFVFP